MKNVGNNLFGHPAGSSAAATTSAEERHRLNSKALFGVRSEIVIVHNDEEYRLRITSNGKLILTK